MHCRMPVAPSASGRADGLSFPKLGPFSTLAGAGF
jgi:hypothetical protein